MELAQGGFRRLEAGELYEVTAFEERAEALLLVEGQVRAGPKLDEELFRGPLRRAKAEPFFETHACGVGDQSAEAIRIAQEGEGFGQSLLRAHMRRHRRWQRRKSLSLP